MATSRIDLGLYGQDTDLKTKLDSAKASISDLRELGKHIALGLDDDKFKVQLLDATQKLDALDRKTSKPSIRLEGADKALVDIAKVSVAMDELGRKSDDLSEKMNKTGLAASITSLFRKLTGNSSNANSSEASEGSSGPEGALPIAGGLGIGLGAALLPSITGLLTGLGVGGLGAIGAYETNPKPFTNLASELEKELSGALSTNVQAPNARAGNRSGGTFSIPGTSFISGIDAILKQLGNDVKSVGPELADMFRASLPFISQFAGALLPIAKSLMPAFTDAMQEMVKSGALKEMTSGLVEIVTDGLVPFLKVLGPGMKDSSIVFRATVLTIDGILIGIGAVATGIARSLDLMGHATADAGKAFDDIGRVIAALLTGNWTALKNAIAAMGNNFRNFFATLADELDLGFIKLSDFGHDVAGVFDDIRHNVAAIWDATWNDVSTYLKNQTDADTSDLKRWWDDLTNVFDVGRHDLAAIWDEIWNDTIGAAQRGIQNVESKVTGFRGDVLTILRALPGDLLTLGKDAMNDFWNGIKSVGDSLLSWAKSLLGDFVSGIKKFLGIASPSSVFHSIGMNLMQGLANGVKAGIRAVSGSFAGVTGEVTRWTADVQAALRMLGLPQSYTATILKQIMTESGGNPNAINLTDINAQEGHPSQGLMQTIPSTFAAYRSPSLPDEITNPLSNIYAGIHYAEVRYGRSGMLDVLGHGHGYALGGLISEPIVGMGLRSGMSYSFGENGPETVTPGTSRVSAGGDTYYIMVAGDTDPDGAALRIIQKVRDYKRHHGNQSTGIG